MAGTRDPEPRWVQPLVLNDASRLGTAALSGLVDVVIQYGTHVGRTKWINNGTRMVVRKGPRQNDTTRVFSGGLRFKLG